MLNHELRQDDGILALHPERPLEAADFTSLASDVDAYSERHGGCAGAGANSAVRYNSGGE